MATKSKHDDMVAAIPTGGAMKEKKGFEKYEIEGAASDIKRAHEHMQNKPLMKEVKKHLKTSKKAMDSMMAALPADDDEDEVKSIADIKKKRQKAFEPKE